MVRKLPSSDNIYGSYSPVSFEVVDINVGGAWQISTNQVIVPLSGKYYVVVDMSSCNYYYIQFELYVNNIKSTISRYLSNNVNGTFSAATSRGQSGVMELRSGDILYLSAPGTLMCFFGPYISFSGIFLGTF